MDQQKLQKFPVINFSQENLKPGTYNWSSACNKIRHALEEFGCFVAVYEQISLKLRDSIFSSVQQLFDLPLETKIKNISDKPFCGYFGQYPIQEGLGIADATNIEEIKSFSKLMWPCGNDNFCGIIHDYTKILCELEQVVTKMVFGSYGLEKHCDSHIESTTYLLRFNAYRGLENNEISVGAQPHTDKSFLTILDQNQVNGLEVKLKDDEQWIAVDFLPSSFVVMAGEGLMAWSNNRIHPCFHRVIMSGNVTRFSMGLFSYHKGIIHIPEEFIDEENPRCFKPFDHLGLLTFFAKQMQMGRISHCTMKAYCGL